MEDSRLEPYRARVRREHRVKILQAAEDHLALVGCERFTIDVVAGSVGLTRTALYRHIGSRSSLIEQTLEQAGKRAAALVAEITEGEPDATSGQRLGDYVRAVVDRVRWHRAATGFLQLPYPCCMAQRSCPYANQDSMHPLLVAELKAIVPPTLLHARANPGNDTRIRPRRQKLGQTPAHLLADPTTDAPLLARLFRAMLHEILVDAHDVQTAELDRSIELMVQLIDCRLGVGPPRPES